MEDAQDLAQEVFIKLYQVLEKYDAQRPFFPLDVQGGHQCLLYLR
ncbi:MAG: sigma factor [Bacillota bacterium]